MALRFRLGQIVLVIALVAGLASTIAARDDDSRSKDAKDSKKSDSQDRDDRDNDRRDNDRRDNDRRDNDRDDRDRDHDNDRDHDDDDSHHHVNKVTICHKENRHGGKTITVSSNAVAAHQQHGDTLGACPVSASR